MIGAASPSASSASSPPSSPRGRPHPGVGGAARGHRAGRRRAGAHRAPPASPPTGMIGAASPSASSASSPASVAAHRDDRRGLAERIERIEPAQLAARAASPWRWRCSPWPSSRPASSRRASSPASVAAHRDDRRGLAERIERIEPAQLGRAGGLTLALEVEPAAIEPAGIERIERSQRRRPPG